MLLSVSPDGSCTISGKGFGHGVGLCSWGANGYAKTHPDVTYQDILKRYYTGIEVRTLYGGPVAADSQTSSVQSQEPGRTQVTPVYKETGSSLILNSRVGAIRK